jgi:molybdopterin-guanine dinucleotide biosynthesis protein A
MSDEHARVSPEFLASIQPIVLVGGKSRRFGRDKLIEPWGAPGRVLVQQPIDALRAIFGPRVKLVGACDECILPLADGVIPDEHPGVGPIGGIISALLHWGGPVFVLAGDMPNFTPSDGRRLLSIAQRHPERLAVMAVTDRPHPCAGYYASGVLPILADCLARGIHRLSRTIPDDRLLLVPVAAESVVNVNTPR